MIQIRHLRLGALIAAIAASAAAQERTGFDRRLCHRGDMVNPETEWKARVIATVLPGFEEVCTVKADLEQFYQKIVNTFYPPGNSDPARQRRRKWSEAATELVGGRTNGFLRSFLALVVYYFGIVSALVEQLGGGGTSAGGRIASAIFLSWLVPLVLLSNTFGPPSLRRKPLDILILFLEPVPGETLQHGNDVGARGAQGGWTGALEAENMRNWVATFLLSSRESDWATGFPISCRSGSEGSGGPSKSRGQSCHPTQSRPSLSCRLRSPNQRNRSWSVAIHYFLNHISNLRIRSKTS